MSDFLTILLIIVIVPAVVGVVTYTMELKRLRDKRAEVDSILFGRDQLHKDEEYKKK